MPKANVRPDFSDQTGFFDPANNAHTVTMIGCGGIGASVLPTLVTMGFERFNLWDPDVVEPRNMASQLAYGPSHLYRPKVVVMDEFLRSYGAVEVETHQELFSLDSAAELEGIVIGAVDSMAARRMIFDAVSYNPNVSLLIDGRIGGEFWQMFTIEPFNPDHLAWYEEFWLFADEEAAELPCAMRAVVYPAVALGAYMASQLAAYSRGETLPRKVQCDMRTMNLEKMN